MTPFLRRVIAPLVLLAGCASLEVRAVAFNAASGAGYTSPDVRDAQRAFLASCRPDVAFVSEVDVGTSRNGGGNVLRQVWPESAVSLFGGTGLLDASPPGWYGVGLMVAPGLVEVKRTEVVPLPAHIDEEPRVALVVDVELSGAALRLVSTHLSAYGPDVEAVRALQAQAVLALVKGPTIIGGDFNGADVGAAASSDVLGVVVHGLPVVGVEDVEAPPGVTDHRGAAVAVIRLN